MIRRQYDIYKKHKKSREILLNDQNLDMLQRSIR